MGVSPTAPGGDALVDGALLGQITDVLRAIARAMRAHQLYLPNNPMHTKALEGVRETLTALWRETDSARLTVTENELLVEGAPVLDEGERGGESLSWLLYKDGIRSFEITAGFEEGDLGKFLDALRVARNRSADDEDLITLFWEADFSHFTYEYVDVSVDASGAPGAEMLRGGAATAGTVPMPASHREAAPEQPQFARMDDFDSTLYFLEEAEVEAVQDAIRQEFVADPRPSVVDALLDTFERESDAGVRDELCDDLELLVLALMSGGNVASVAYALRELEVAIMRAPSLLPRHRDRVRALLERLSEATVVDQLLSYLEEVTPKPDRADVEALLARFGATALTPLLAHAARVREPQLRDLLDDAITRLAAANTAELARLIESADADVSLEAIRRAGDLRTPAAVAPIAQLIASGTVEQRRAAIGALGAIATPGAMQILERAIDDDDRALRLLAVEAVVAKQHRPAVPRIEKGIREWVTRIGTSAEKTAFFDAYVVLAGDTAVPTLDALLNKRDLLRRTEESSTRAAAALALGRLHSERALSALGKAASDKDVVVRTAVTRALRGTA